MKLYHLAFLSRISICSACILIISTSVFAQKRHSIKEANFNIVVERTANEIKMTCNKGCSWETLKFTIPAKDKVQAIDENGMATLGKDKNEVAEPTAFLFTVKTTPKGLQYKGLKGTSWVIMDYECTNSTCRQVIDHNGMTTEVSKH